MQASSSGYAYPHQHQHGSQLDTTNQLDTHSGPGAFFADQKFAFLDPDTKRAHKNILNGSPLAQNLEAFANTAIDDYKQGRDKDYILSDSYLAQISRGAHLFPEHTVGKEILVNNIRIKYKQLVLQKIQLLHQTQ